EELPVNILHATGAVLIITGPDEDHIAIGESSHGGIDLEIVGEGAGDHITAQPEIAAAARAQKAGVNVLETAPAALPDEGRPAVVQEGNLGIFLVGRADLIDAERGAGGREVIVQSQGA